MKEKDFLIVDCFFYVFLLILFVFMVKNMLYLNVVVCYFKMGECRKFIEVCEKVCWDVKFLLSM